MAFANDAPVPGAPFPPASVPGPTQCTGELDALAQRETRIAQMIASAPQPSEALLGIAIGDPKSAGLQFNTVDLDLLHKPFPDCDMQDATFGKVPTHRAYIRRISELKVPVFYTVLAYCWVETSSDIWVAALGRMTIPGAGIVDAVGGVSFRDKCVDPKYNGKPLDQLNYAGFHPNGKKNKSDLTTVWPAFIKMAETAAYVRCATRLGVGLDSSAASEEVAHDFGAFTPGAAFGGAIPDAAAPTGFPPSPFAAPPAGPAAQPVPFAASAAPAVAAAGFPPAPFAAPAAPTPSASPPPAPFAAPVVPFPPPPPATAGIPAIEGSSPPCVSSLQAAATPEQIDRLRATAAASGVDIERMAAEWGATVETLNAAQAVALENRIRSDARRGA